MGSAVQCRNEPLAGAGIRQIYSPPASAAAPTPQPAIPASTRHSSLPCSTTAPRRARRFVLTGTRRDGGSKDGHSSVPHALELVALYLARAVIPQGLGQGQGHHAGRGCQVLDQQRLSFPKTLHILSSPPCGERSRRLPCPDLRRSVPLPQKLQQHS